MIQADDRPVQDICESQAVKLGSIDQSPLSGRRLSVDTARCYSDRRELTGLADAALNA